MVQAPRTSRRRVSYLTASRFLCRVLGKVVEQYERQGLVARVDGNQGIEAVFRDVVAALEPVQEKEVLDANRLAVEAAWAGDRPAYAEVGGVRGGERYRPWSSCSF